MAGQKQNEYRMTVTFVLVILLCSTVAYLECSPAFSALHGNRPVIGLKGQVSFLASFVWESDSTTARFVLFCLAYFLAPIALAIMVLYQNHKLYHKSR